jgi:hypothetical protein
MNNKYQRGKIYKIIDNTNGNQYIGSTCEKTLSHRLAKHVGSYKCYLNGKSNYVSSYDILANVDYDIILIELYPCNSKDELLARERYYKDTLICVNKNRPGIFNELGQKEYVKQYRVDNKERIKKYEAKYRTHHKEHIKNRNAKYYTDHKEHVNFLKQQQILADHDTVMIEIVNLILNTNKFIELSENFIKRLNI